MERDLYAFNSNTLNNQPYSMIMGIIPISHSLFQKVRQRLELELKGFKFLTFVFQISQ